MEPLNFSRSQALNNIPSKKSQDYFNSIINSSDDNKVKIIKLMAANRYTDGNIPIMYWDLKMEKDFVGDPRLLKKYNEYITDLKSVYINGKSLCLAGSYGLGKTFTNCCILKLAALKGYSVLYTTLSDVISVLTQSDDKYNAKQELTMVDFLCLDEVDSRFISSDNSADLFARSLETIFRTRLQNKLPTLMCTNSPNIVESFNGNLKQSIESLIKGNMEIFPVFGDDFRKIGIK